ncbi:MAG TPA: hypothetical protein VGM73_11710 [Candidatus Didemnitutus sp.]
MLSAEFTTQLTGGFRQQRWCEYFLDRGHSVRSYSMTSIFRVDVSEFTSTDELRRRRDEWIKSAPPGSGHRQGPHVRVARFFKHVLLADLFYPCVWNLFWKLWRDSGRERGRIVLLCSSPPFAPAVLSALLKMLGRSHLVLALDMRDHWSLHGVRARFRWHKRAIERFVMRRTDHLTTIGPTMARDFRAAFGIEAAIAYNVATHVSRAPGGGSIPDWARLHPRLRSETLKIVYTGSLPEGYYDLPALISACSGAWGPQIREANCLQFIFVGRAWELQRQLPGGEGWEDLMVFVPQVSQGEAAAIQAAADVLLFLGLNSPNNMGQVSMKIFEYFRSGRAVLPLFVHSGSDVDRLIADYCGRPLNLMNAAEIANALRRLESEGADWLPRPSSGRVDAELMRDYERVVQILLGELARSC